VWISGSWKNTLILYYLWVVCFRRIKFDLPPPPPPPPPPRQNNTHTPGLNLLATALTTSDTQASLVVFNKSFLYLEVHLVAEQTTKSWIIWILVCFVSHTWWITPYITRFSPFLFRINPQHPMRTLAVHWVKTGDLIAAYCGVFVIVFCHSFVV
jgi:hypothetical protein